MIKIFGCEWISICVILSSGLNFGLMTLKCRRVELAIFSMPMPATSVLQINSEINRLMFFVVSALSCLKPEGHRHQIKIWGSNQVIIPRLRSLGGHRQQIMQYTVLDTLHCTANSVTPLPLEFII